jgi:hypothetical protein
MKRILFIALLFVASASVKGQFYVHFTTGYSFATNPAIQQNRVVTDNLISLYKIRFSYGKGLNLNLSAGYRLSEHLSAELLASTALFTTSHSDHNWKKYFEQEYVLLHLTGLNGDARMRNASAQLSPMLVYSVTAGKWIPYVKAGINLLFVKSTYTNYYTYRYTNENNEVYLENTSLKRIYTGNWNLGFRGAIGIMYPISDNLSLTTEFMAVNSSYRFKESETVKFDVDGVDKLSTVTDNPRKFTGNEGIVDYSHIGIHAGIRWTIK